MHKNYLKSIHLQFLYKITDNAIKIIFHNHIYMIVVIFLPFHRRYYYCILIIIIIYWLLLIYILYNYYYLLLIFFSSSLPCSIWWALAITPVMDSLSRAKLKTPLHLRCLSIHSYFLPGELFSFNTMTALDSTFQN